jgi:hypothetical protein
MHRTKTEWAVVCIDLLSVLLSEDQSQTESWRSSFSQCEDERAQSEDMEIHSNYSIEPFRLHADRVSMFKATTYSNQGETDWFLFHSPFLHGLWKTKILPAGSEYMSDDRLDR